MTRRMIDKKESKSSQSLPCLFQNCLRGWKLIKRKDLRKLKNRKPLVKDRVLLSDHHCPRKFLTLKECTKNLLQKWKEIRVHRG